MLRTITTNLNGIRSAANKGYFDWLCQQNAAVVGVQEVKAQHEQVAGVFDCASGLTGYFHFAQKKGYAGVGLYTRIPPSDLVVGMGVPEFDAEGRWVEARFDRRGRKLSIISCYFPSGSSGPERQEAKFRFLDGIYPKLMQLKAEREFLLLGDINIAHQEIDLKNWKSNQRNSGFLPEERAWMGKLLGEGGLVLSLIHISAGFCCLNCPSTSCTDFTGSGVKSRVPTRFLGVINSRSAAMQATSSRPDRSNLILNPPDGRRIVWAGLIIEFG